jgi:hypothetical protein
MSGIFGGGLFGGSMAGLDARPRPVGLGLTTVTGRYIPDSCFPSSAFQDCAIRQFASARAVCKGDGWSKLGYRDIFACEADQHDVATINMCVPKHCGGEGAPAAAFYPWGVHSADTEQLQRDLNTILKPNDRCPLAVDGKLGPGTCGAAKWADANFGGVVTTPPPPFTCKSFTEPGRCPSGETPVVVAPPLPAPPPPLAPRPPQKSSKASMWAIGGLLAAVAVGGAYALSRKKKRRS